MAGRVRLLPGVGGALRGLAAMLALVALLSASPGRAEVARSLQQLPPSSWATMRPLPLPRKVSTLQLRTNRKNVIIAGLGTKSMHSVSWFDRQVDVTFDLLGIYYGTAADSSKFACVECTLLYRASGTKWMILRELVTSRDWPTILGTYDAFMLADDDLIMSAGVIARSFALFEAYHLQLAQPSVCGHAGGATSHATLRARARTRLRYTAFVEVQMPMVSRATFRDTVIPTLAEAHTGWGLDYVWPFVLGFPRDGIAVLDDVCAFHPAAQPGKESTYSLPHPAGLQPWDELLTTIAAFGLNTTTLAAKGLSVPSVLDVRDVVWASVPVSAPLPRTASCGVHAGTGKVGEPRCALDDVERWDNTDLPLLGAGGYAGTTSSSGAVAISIASLAALRDALPLASLALALGLLAGAALGTQAIAVPRARAARGARALIAGVLVRARRLSSAHKDAAIDLVIRRKPSKPSSALAAPDTPLALSRVPSGNGHSNGSGWASDGANKEADVV